MGGRDQRIRPHYENALKYGQIIRDTVKCNGFQVGDRTITWRPDDCGFSITYHTQDRRVSFVVTQVVKFCRVGKTPEGVWEIHEGAVELQDDTWMLLRWLDSGFPPQLPEVRSN